MTFAERLDEVIERTASLLCVGLDPDGLSSAADVERFCDEILGATLEHVCAVKANAAFFEQHGAAGYRVLERVRAKVPRDRLLIIDGKRGDIANTSAAYARALFDVLGADAVTVNPLMGGDAVAPFLERADRGVFLLTRTSNQGASDLLDEPMADARPLHAHIVELGLGWDPGGTVGFVVGATDAAAVSAVRSLAGDAPLLLPGIGAQGGALEQSVRAGVSARGRRLLVAVSRGITQSPEGASRAAASLAERITKVRRAGAAA
ncbi:MAG: orotidine-5'-phosphate decarboxylase [Candidatus Dormibacteria bacterium]